MTVLIAIQEAIDISFHIVVDEGWGLPATYAEGFDLLATHGLIEPDTARALSGMAALSNRLAHGYASVNHERLWGELPNGLEALGRLIEAVALFVERQQQGA